MRKPISVRIDEVAFGGRGVGRLEDGRVVFVPFVLSGELVKAEIVREHRSYAEARLVAVEEASPHRVEPPCPYYGRCGGCSYQHVAREEQLAIKQRQVASVLRRVGHLNGDAVQAIIPSPLDYGYRERITVHTRDGAVGYFSQDLDRRELLDVKHCPIASPAVNEELTLLRARSRGFGRGGAARTGTAHYTLRAGDAAQRFFRQTNEGAAARLLDLVRGLVEQSRHARHLIDAYCGGGFFAKALAERFTKVTGIEWDRYAVAFAERGATPRERYLQGDVAVHLPEALSAADGESTTLIVDPPAEGMARPVVEAILARPPRTLIYISCNPATLARDLQKLLGEARWCLSSVTPIDMFPQTAEIEAVAHLAPIDCSRDP